MATSLEAASAHGAAESRGEEFGLLEFWTERGDIELTAPRKNAVPFIWRWKDLHPILRRAAKTVPIEKAERRALLFANPGLKPRPHMTSTLYGGCSLYNPGEVAPVHRHSPNASRFLLEGEGAYTTIEGEKCAMERGDLVINPNGAWHDHGNEGDAPIIWIDMLDVPLVEGLNATKFEFEYFERGAAGSNSGDPVRKYYQTVTAPRDHSNNLYGGPGLKPTFVSHERGRGIGTPKLVYRWSETSAALERLRGYAGSPYDGVILEYFDPISGAPVTPTMSFEAQLLRPGEATLAHRHTSSTAYTVIEGNGATEIDGVLFEWSRHDVFVVPAWLWHRHINRGASDDAILYAVSDRPALQKLCLYREEGRTAQGETVEVAP